MILTMGEQLSLPARDPRFLPSRPVLARIANILVVNSGNGSLLWDTGGLSNVSRVFCAGVTNPQRLSLRNVSNGYHVSDIFMAFPHV